MLKLPETALFFSGLRPSGGDLINWFSLVLTGSKVVGWQLCSNTSYPLPAAALLLPPPGPVDVSLKLLKLDRGLHHYLLEAAYSWLSQVRSVLSSQPGLRACVLVFFFFKFNLREEPGCPERPPSTCCWPHLSPPSPGTCR